MRYELIHISSIQQISILSHLLLSSYFFFSLVPTFIRKKLSMHFIICLKDKLHSSQKHIPFQVCVYLSVCLYVCLYVYVSVCMRVCMCHILEFELGGLEEDGKLDRSIKIVLNCFTRIRSGALPNLSILIINVSDIFIGIIYIIAIATSRSIVNYFS